MFRLLSNNRGESIVTLMISAVILLAVAMMAAPSILNSLRQQQNSVGAPNLCRSVAHNLINQIRADGVQSHFYPTRVNSTGTLLNDPSWHAGNSFNPNGVTNEQVVNASLQAQRWPARRVVNFTLGTPPFRSDSPLLIHSSVNGLQALYNSTPTICNPGLPVTETNQLSNLFPGATIGDYDVAINLIVRPYDWASRAILPCNRPLLIRPYGTHEPPMAQQLGIADFSRYQANRGLEVEVQVTTTKTSLDPNAQPERPTVCVVKEKFEFDRIVNEPRAPVVTANGGRFTFQNVMTAGTHMVCRSTHYFLVDLLGRATGSAAGVGNRTDWLPCDRLRVCGDNGTTAVDEANATITKTFNIPDNCVATVEAKTFDAIGNVSDTQPANAYGNSSRVPSSFDETSDSTVNGYEVGGVQFSTIEAATRASAISGLPMQTIAEVPAALGMDAVMNSVYGNVQNAGNGYSNAASHNANAQSSLAAAQSAAGSATSSTSSASSARDSATAARDAANSAASSASAARDAATAARDAANAVAAEAGALGNAIGDPAVAEAEAAAAAAEAEAAAAEEAARQAAAAAAAAEAAAAAKEAEEAADDADDN